MTYNILYPLTPYTRALTNMGTTLNEPLTASHNREVVLSRLMTLTECEREICLLHFVDDRPQTLIAEWLGINRQSVIEHLESAIRKVPELIPLRTLSEGRAPRVRILHLSQLPPGDRGNGPFNIDEL